MHDIELLGTDFEYFKADSPGRIAFLRASHVPEEFAHESKPSEKRRIKFIFIVYAVSLLLNTDPACSLHIRNGRP